MAVIVHLQIPADSFELGRILDMRTGSTVELEEMVPLGEKAVPFFSVNEADQQSFESNVRKHPSVGRLTEVSSHDDETLYSIDWNVARDVFLQGVVDHDGHLLSARGAVETWTFELRFPDHDTLCEFKEYCSNAHIPLEVDRVFNPTPPGAGAWYGLTETQRRTLVTAVRGGYYAIPREMSTQDLADEFGVSDQAVAERLRRAIVTLVENTLVAMEDEQTQEVTTAY